MKLFGKQIKILGSTYGMFAIANILICGLSGVFLAIPYDIANPYESISRIMLFNPAASFIRNIHYWSAQLFLIFTLLHIWDHFKKQGEKKVKNGVWFRLTLSILVVFFVMLSGFILKADADSLQARRILSTLIESIPLIGNILSFGLLGDESSFQLLYVHHIATATIIIFLLIYEHAKNVWGTLNAFYRSLIVLVLLSFFMTAPLHDNLDPVVKGPWYFTGLQEILHWLSQPAWSMLIILILLVMLYFIPRLNAFREKTAKRILLYSFWCYLLLTVVGFYFRGENWRLILPWQENYFEEVWFPDINRIRFRDHVEEIPSSDFKSVYQRQESCLICHADMQGFRPSHSPEAIGCVSCHQGNAFALNKEAAHRGMITIPGNLADAERSCGTADCHPDIVNRITKSIMQTASGMVSVDKYVLGESEHLSKLSHIEEIGKSPADIHLRTLCASCHIGNPKTEYAPVSEMTRGGGCLACHMNYSADAKKELEAFKKRQTKQDFTFSQHPSIDMPNRNDHCFGCHSRSGRISTNYEGWHETQLEIKDIDPHDTNFRILEDKRVFQYIKEDVHHSKGLLCIDCHNSYEIMGDGNLYMHKEEQVKIACKDCHRGTETHTIGTDQLDVDAKKIVSLKNWRIKNQQFLKTEKSGLALVNTFVTEGDSAFLISKKNGETHYIKKQADFCFRDKAHQRLSCESCHSSWVPRCISCHTEFNPTRKAFDHLEKGVIRGKWTEHAGNFDAGVPSLAVFEYENETEIKTVVPGMILTIDNTGEKKKFYKPDRYFAPASPHTVIKPEKNCKKCHLDPIRLGYGEGQLHYTTEGNKSSVSFIPNYEKLYDLLPADAWIDFLQTRTKKVATRSYIRPFNTQEQKKLLNIGACLNCHEENSAVMQASLIDYAEVFRQRKSVCKIPFEE
jgi:formate-dependent nitrite reductase cytochrome c552 subunit